MDKRPIGVFDSGLGGLTAVESLSALLPGEDIIYFGDTGRVPYGTRSAETIIKYARSDIAFLLSHDIKRILIACGTVSSAALPRIKDEYPIPMTGVVRCAAAKAAATTKSGRVGIIGTSATVRSGAYEKQLLALDPSIKTVSVACPLFVPLVENARTSPDDIVVSTIVAEYLETVSDFGVDALILGCTHYPLLWEAISRYMGEQTALISPGAEAAAELRAELVASGCTNGRDFGGKTSFFVSDCAEDFEKNAGLYLKTPISGQVSRVDIGQY